MQIRSILVAAALVALASAAAPNDSMFRAMKTARRQLLSGDDDSDHDSDHSGHDHSKEIKNDDGFTSTLEEDVDKKAWAGNTIKSTQSCNDDDAVELKVTTTLDDKDDAAPTFDATFTFSAEGAGTAKVVADFSSVPEEQRKALDLKKEETIEGDLEEIDTNPNIGKGFGFRAKLAKMKMTQAVDSDNEIELAMEMYLDVIIVDYKYDANIGAGDRVTGTVYLEQTQDATMKVNGKASDSKSRAHSGKIKAAELDFTCRAFRPYVWGAGGLVLVLVAVFFIRRRNKADNKTKVEAVGQNP